MHKFVKIAISLLLIFSLILNPFSFIFSIKAEALDPATIGAFFLFILEEAAKGFIIGQSAYLSGEVTDQVIQAQEIAEHQQTTALNAVQSGIGISIDTNDGHIVASRVTNSDLTDEEQEFADFFVDYINESYFFTRYDPVNGWHNLTIDDYESLKTEITKAYNEYTLNKIAEETRLQSLLDMIDAGVFPTYDFDFVGPQPSFIFPSSYSMAHIVKDGFLYTPPISSNLYNSSGRITIEECEIYASGLDSVNKSGTKDSGFYFTASFTGYSGGTYIIYNNVIYYKVIATFTDSALSRSVNSFLIKSTSFTGYKSVEGVVLSDVYTGGSYSQGVFYNKTGESPVSYPSYMVNDNDFRTEAGGCDVEIPRTEEEDIIGQALGLGILNPDSTIDISDDGTITGADGITLAKLQELADLIKEGNLQFEDFQQYLDLITKLIGAGNMTASEQAIILDNIKDLEKSQADDISAIRTAIESMTIETELEDVDLSYLTVEHHGLVEAQTIVDTALPIVAQSKQLLSNIFNQAEASSSVPNFIFYWDSDKDGFSEEYTFFDLSFMETPLVNDNLADKSRFTDSNSDSKITVRDFIHSLIVFIVYAVYLVKLLRRIPGLLGSSEGMADDIKTINGGK